jgi:4-amino-4-deoxy-L-arabinose transferase-like glycosyltransferase
VAVVLATAVLYLHGLGGSPLLEPDEGRYAEIPREMLASGDWLVPRLDDMPYLQKPPATYWATAVAYRVLGVNEATARLAPALAAIGTVALTAWFGARSFGIPAGVAAGAMLATTPFFYLIGRLAILDMPLTFFLTLAVIALHRAMEDGTRRWQLGAGLAMGAGVLTKGLVGLALPVGIVLVFAAVERDPRALRRALGPWTLAPALLLPVPWFWALERRLPGFLEFFFVRHHLLRYAVGGKIGHAHHVWYLPAAFIAGALPWSLVGVAGVLRARPEPAPDGERFCVVWMLVVMGFFMTSRISLATYVCPAFVPLALVAGRAWTDGRAGKGAVAVWGFLAALTLLVAITPASVYAPVVGRLVYRRWWSVALALRPSLAVAAGIVLVGATIAALARGRGVALTAVTGTLAIGLALADVARDAFPSAATIGAVAHARRGEADRLVSYGHFPRGLPFYARRRTVIVAWSSMEDFGTEPSRAIVWSERRLVRAWNGRRRLFLVIAPAEWRRLRRRLSRPAAVLAFERGRVLVTNAPLGARLGSAPRRAAEAHDRVGVGLGALEPDQVSRALDRLQPGARDAGGEDPAVERRGEAILAPP